MCSWSTAAGGWFGFPAGPDTAPRHWNMVCSSLAVCPQWSVLTCLMVPSYSIIFVMVGSFVVRMQKKNTLKPGQVTHKKYVAVGDRCAVETWKEQSHRTRTFSWIYWAHWLIFFFFGDLCHTPIPTQSFLMFQKAKYKGRKKKIKGTNLLWFWKDEMRKQNEC